MKKECDHRCYFCVREECLHYDAIADLKEFVDKLEEEENPF